jgi:cellulose biosynthesis protein BcsQ
MALANIAIVLAQQGLRVLLVDFDLEAPGLNSYLAPLKSLEAQEGILEILVNSFTEDGSKHWRDYVSKVPVRNGTTLHVITSGKQDESYSSRLNDFDWTIFFSKFRGGEFIEKLRKEWKGDYDITLIDSRTGITDTGGVCTIQLPDTVVAVVTPNDQSLEGIVRVCTMAQRGRQDLAYDRPKLTVFPLLSRLDVRTEFKEAQKWLDLSAASLEHFYENWLPSHVSPRQMLERTKIPYVSYYSFGEKLAVLDGTSDPEGIGFAFRTAASLIASNFKYAQDIILSQESAPNEITKSDLTLFNFQKVGARISSALSNSGFADQPSLVLAAVTQTPVDLIEMVESNESETVRLLRRPPNLRSSGFDLGRFDEMPLTGGGLVRRGKRAREFLELWRDGTLISAITGDKLFWAHEERGGGQMSIHPLALAETALIFCDLSSRIFKRAKPNPGHVLYFAELRRLHSGVIAATIEPREVGRFPVLRPLDEARRIAPADGERFYISARLVDDPAETAFRLLSEIYVWFGVEMDKIPYATRRNDAWQIDIDKIRSVPVL